MQGTSALRRDPETILTAHLMDPSRRDLYVEGLSDRLFIEWVLSGEMHKDARVIEIDAVEIPSISEGGNRARVLALAEFMENHSVELRCLVDADFDRVLSIPLPSKVILTDHRDMEGYLLREDCFDKSLRLGLQVEKWTGKALLEQVLKLTRTLGLLRLTDATKGLHLPFQKTDLGKHISVQGTRIQLQFERYVGVLLQNAGISRKEVATLIEEVTALDGLHSATADDQLAHGKDVVCFFGKIAQTFGIQLGDAARILRCSIEKSSRAEYPNLMEVCRFLTGATAS